MQQSTTGERTPQKATRRSQSALGSQKRPCTTVSREVTSVINKVNTASCLSSRRKALFSFQTSKESPKVWTKTLPSEGTIKAIAETFFFDPCTKCISFLQQDPIWAMHGRSWVISQTVRNLYDSLALRLELNLAAHQQGHPAPV